MPRPAPTAPALPRQPPTEAEVTEQTRRFAGTLSKRNRERLRAAVNAMIKRFEETVAAHAPRQPVACAAGCTYCCHMLVSATAPELFAIAEHVAGLPAERRAALTKAIATADAKTSGLSISERAALAHPCPMLENGLCQIYPVRPLTCRSYGSFDRDACAQAHGRPDADVPIPVPRVPMAMRRFLLYSFRAALAERGLDANSYELIGGLHRVLETPRAESRWLAGEDVLAGVQTTAPPPGGRNSRDP